MDQNAKYQVIGLRPDKTRFVIARGLTRETADKVVNLACAGPQSLLIEPEGRDFRAPSRLVASGSAK